MTDQGVSCSLAAAELQRRLQRIAELGASSLVSRHAGEDRHLLRFRSDEATRLRLEEIIAAEVECCSFLDLDLDDEGGELVLRIAAAPGGRPIADQLAAAFDR